jgi:LytS/YehU family sensor histidine kinase
MQLEFGFFKSQVNPHFLFNTLNNIYSLILHDRKDQSADMVARLSAFMRYTLHDASAEKAPMNKELKLMSDYVELERIRLNHTLVRSQFATEGNGYLLPPLLFIPLLENAFKYVIDSQGSFIDINLHISQDRLQFVCRNSYDPANGQRQEGGIGLSNVHKRLEQYYPGKYSYNINSDNAVYSVNLAIDLNWSETDRHML